MRDLFSGLACLHNLASEYGDGLKPELLAIVQRAENVIDQGAVPLPGQPASVGPKHQFASPADLEAAGIPTLCAARPSQKRSA